jgi:hypothetical protein
MATEAAVEENTRVRCVLTSTSHFDIVQRARETDTDTDINGDRGRGRDRDRDRDRD